MRIRQKADNAQMLYDKSGDLSTRSSSSPSTLTFDDRHDSKISLLADGMDCTQIPLGGNRVSGVLLPLDWRWFGH
jgi:hypothetical protein